MLLRSNLCDVPHRRGWLPATLLALIVALSGCQGISQSSGKDETAPPVPLEIIGTYTDEFGGTQSITAADWSDSYGDVFHIRSYSNELDYLLAQNDPANPYNGGLYSRFDWSTYNSYLYYCQSVYSAPDLSTAQAGSADRTNPSTSGCGGFPWTNLTPPTPLDIIGNYTDEFGATQTITATEWSDSYGDVFHILSYSNESGFLIAQNDQANPYNGGLYSRFDWSTFNSDLYYCQSVYNAPDISTAQAGSADRTNPSTGGCGGFPWTNLTPPPGP